MGQPALVGSVLFGADEMVAAMVAQRIGGDVAKYGFGECTALGVIRRGVLIGGVVYHNYRGHSITASDAFDRPDWCYPQTLRTLFSYPFVQLGCVRLEAWTARKNARARKWLKGIGFREVGIAKRAFDGRQDAALYELLRDHCGFLNRTKDNGQVDPASAAAA